jgi:cytochrome oxidase Cu insertion factor (SCO1/SenC/PrrC family)
MNRNSMGTLIVVLLSLGASMTGAQDAGVSSHPMIGEAAPAFDLAEVGGEILSLESLKGKYVVLHFGASW